MNGRVMGGQRGRDSQPPSLSNNQQWGICLFDWEGGDRSTHVRTYACKRDVRTQARSHAPLYLAGTVELRLYTTAPP